MLNKNNVFVVLRLRSNVSVLVNLQEYVILLLCKLKRNSCNFCYSILAPFVIANVMEGITVEVKRLSLPFISEYQEISSPVQDIDSKLQEDVLANLERRMKRFKSPKERFAEELKLTADLRKMINDVVENAVIKAHKVNEICFQHGHGQNISYDPELFGHPDPYYDLPNVGNPFGLTTENFNPALGLKMIQHFMRTWRLSRNWVDFTSFREKVEQLYTTRYNYHVIFGMPTPVQPLPMEIGRAFFTFVSIKWKAPDFPLDFYYRIEGSYYVHRNGDKFEFSPEWAESAVQTKLALKYRIIDYILRKDDVTD